MKPTEYKTNSVSFQVFDRYIIARVSAEVDVDREQVK